MLRLTSVKAIAAAIVSLIAMVLTVGLAFVYAYALTRTRMPGRGVFRLVAMLPIFALFNPALGMTTVVPGAAPSSKLVNANGPAVTDCTASTPRVAGGDQGALPSSQDTVSAIQPSTIAVRMAFILRIFSGSGRTTFGRRAASERKFRTPLLRESYVGWPTHLSVFS